METLRSRTVILSPDTARLLGCGIDERQAIQGDGLRDPGYDHTRFGAILLGREVTTAHFFINFLQTFSLCLSPFPSNFPT